MAYIYPFRMASATATMLLIDPVAREVIIGVRNRNAWVYPGYDSLPGGFMEARFTQDHADKQAMARATAMVHLDWKIVGDEFHEGENLEQTAVRETREELCVDLDESQFNMFAVRSNSRTDTRAHVVNACYWAELTPEQSAALEAGDDLESIRRLSFDEIENEVEMAFNHREVMIQGFRHYLKHKLFERLVDQHNDSRVVQDFLSNDDRLAKLEKAVANG